MLDAFEYTAWLNIEMYSPKLEDIFSCILGLDKHVLYFNTNYKHCKIFTTRYILATRDLRNTASNFILLV